MIRGYQLGPGIWARLKYQVFDAEGEELASEAVETGFVFGYGALLPALEAALQGKPAGARSTIELAPKDAFGKRDPKLCLEVAREEFPAGVLPGDRFDAEQADGTPLVLQVLEVSESGVVLDLNHPLAGQRVRFDVEVLEARPASPEELALAEAALAEAPTDESEAPGGALIHPARLLRRGSQR
jgi:FKBP-type peptidyl-prolyl cis-trans isomerase SlyD